MLPTNIRFSETPIDTTQPVIRVGEPEVNDATERSNLYRKYEPDFTISPQRGLRIIEKWSRRYGINVN